MAEASFYILPSQSLHERYLFACKLIAKAYSLGQYCYVYTDSPQQCQQLDTLLWTFKDTSFIPHQIYDDQNDIPDYQQSILLGTRPAPKKWQTLIFNLSSKYPEDLTQTKRILEILDNNEALKQMGRQRYRQYEKNGFKMTSYKI